MTEDAEPTPWTVSTLNQVQKPSAIVQNASPEPTSLLAPALSGSSAVVRDFPTEAMASTTTLQEEKTIDDGPFIPRRLEPQRRLHWWIMVALFPSLAVALYFTGSHISSTDPGPIVGSCDYQKSDDTERMVMVDIHVAKDLTFTTAKALDLAWDTIIGQLGRALHGWFFYHVAIRNLTWLNQNFAAPYNFQLSILFDTSSLGSLWATTLLLFKRNKYRRINIVALWMLGSIYVLLFPTIWSAATGYYQPSVTAQTLPTYRSGVFRQVDPNVCWVADLDRIIPGHNGVVVGPHVSDSTFPQLGLGSPLSDWNGTEDFQSLSAYIATKRSIVSFYGGQPISKTSNETTDWLHQNCQRRYLPWISIESDSTLFNCSSDSDMLYSTIVGWQYGTREQMRSQHLTSFRGQLVLENKTQSVAFNKTDPPPPFVGDAWGDTLAAQFHLWNQSAALDPASSVPYNSSLWWQGRTLDIAPPFLNVGFTPNGTRCSPEGQENGLCVCDRGNPIAWEHIAQINQDDLFCVGGQEYVWGFSSRISRLGAFFECIWIISCYFMWISALRCELVRSSRPGTGVARNVLDMAEAIRADLGSNNWAYRERDIMRELDKCHPIGYVMEDVGEGRARIRLRSIPDGLEKSKRKNIKIDKNTLFC